MVRYICFPQICKIHLAYFTISVAVMNWESNFKWETTLQATLTDILVLRKQVVVLAAIEAFDLALLLLVFLVMACASSHRLYVSHPTFNMLLSLGPYFKDPVLNKDLFGILGPYWVLIYTSGSLFSLFWLHSREECQFSLHVYIVYNNELY